MKGKKKKIFNLVVFTSIMALMSYKGVKLVDAKNKAYELVNAHKAESSYHNENVVAHRGFSSLETDHSYESVSLALDCDCADMIEIDVRMTQNGILILHHDSTLSFEDISVRIEDLNLEEVDVEKLNRKYPNFSLENYLYDDTLFQLDRYFSKDFDDTEIITFKSFTSWYSFEKPIIIDVKCSEVNERFEDELYRNLHGHEDKVFIQCYNYDFLKSMQEKYPDFRYLFLVRVNSDIKLMNNDTFTGYTVRSGLLKNIKIDSEKMYFLYTVNSSKKYFGLLNNPKYRDNMYIITDNPDYICALGEAKKLARGKHGENSSVSKLKN